MTKAVPAGFHTVTPALTFKDARKAIDFYKEALGAQEIYAFPGPDGKGIMHAEIKIGDSILMMGEEQPQHPVKSAETAGGSPVGFYIYLDDVDTAFSKAVAAGAQAQMPVQDMFWGDRMGAVVDPFGYNWMLATHKKDMSAEELREASKAAMAQIESAT